MIEEMSVEERLHALEELGIELATQQRAVKGMIRRMMEDLIAVRQTLGAMHMDRNAAAWRAYDEDRGDAHA